MTQLLQKIQSFSEHASADTEGSLACSWSPGLLGRMTIWPYNINYHRQQSLPRQELLPHSDQTRTQPLWYRYLRVYLPPMPFPYDISLLAKRFF